ncbi:hypothetical protein SKAU_G00118420 [Synaphobranchus kaupii]|uniref:Structure-specific endonuclease subunit SLX4 n=1 Tax=Synaphobranchus kaupii TaxID=118154 RepID=A0A9Q1FN21_SYNKA|nr:hypothetical protein SKAU_G00118420 [Synaphobranchus kaupii]
MTESGSQQGSSTPPALCPPVQPWTAETQKAAPLTQAEALPPPEPPSSAASSTPLPTPSTPGLGSQTLGDLMDLAEEGLTLTQWGYAPKPDPAPDSAHTPGPTQDKDTSVADLRLSGFLPERPPTAGGAKSTLALSRLTADLSSMVNNPQLSDVQLQVDSGEVFFAHSFMLYARCPLLVHMVHDSGFGVEEEGMPSAQRVLLGDVPPEAVHVLLQYLYCARYPLTPALVPHLQELAIRLDLRELEQVCHSYTVEPWAESREQEKGDEEECGEQKFLELLRSMWEEEEEEGGGGDGEGEEVEGGAEGRVDEEELLEIYHFAATQRKTEGEEDEEEERGNAGTETEEEQEHKERRVQTASPSHRHSNCLSAHIVASVAELPEWLSTGHMTQEGSELKRAAPIITDGHSGTERAGPDGTSQLSPGQRPNSSLDRSYDRLFSQTWGDYMESSRSQGALIDLSISPVPEFCGSAFPTTGASPGSVRGESVSPSTARAQALKPESRGCSQISISPHTPREQALKPESHDCSQISVSPHTDGHSGTELALKPESRGSSQISISPQTPREQALKPESHGCSQISQMRREPELIVLSDSGEELDVDAGNVATGAEGPSPRLSPVPAGDAGGAGSGPVDGGLSEGSTEDMSWLIPGTPEPPARSTRVSSTQTHCSMRRTRLFATPRSFSSSSSSTSLTTTVSGPPVPLRLAESRERAVPSARPAVRLSPPTPAPADDLSSPALAFAVPLTPPRQSSAPSLAPAHPRNPVLSHVFPRPTSSTPLPPQTSPSAPVPKRTERHPEAVRSSAGSSSAGSPGLWGSSSPSPRKRSPEGGCSSERKDKRGEERMEGGAEEEEDPPMAFDESWGLDGGGGPDLHFSLRLDSSAGASQSEQGSGETTPPAPPPLTPQPDNHARPYTSLLDSKVWDDWEEEEDGASLPLSQRVQPMAAAQRVRQLKTPVASRRKGHAPLVPITPMPGYSDMDTPDLKNRLNRFGVRPLPKRQMVLKLKEIHQYTHQLLSSESEEDGPAPGPAPKPHPNSVSTAFKQPERPAAVEAWSKDSSHKQAGPEEEGEGLSASQGSTASSTAVSEDSDRSNPELCFPSDSEGSDSEGVTASQAMVQGAEKLQAVRRFILSDPELYGRVLRYEPLVLSQLQARLKAHGIRLGAAKLLDFLDSQCVTFTTAKPAKPGPPRGRGRGRGRGRRRGGAAKASE